jgi:hypothetical protein
MDAAVTKPGEEGAPVRDRPFNPNRIAKSERTKRVVAEVLRELQNHESFNGARKRKRRAQDQATFEATVTAVVCDLIHRELTEPAGWIAVPLSKAVLGRRGRYGARALGKTLPSILDRMAKPELAWAELMKGHRGYFGPARRSTLRAGVRLRRRIGAHDLSLNDLGKGTTSEVIILKREKVDFWDAGGLIDYKDTPTTRRYREEMRRINEWLEAADISFDPAPVPEMVVDDTDRHLRRYFNNASFDQGGRLFGGFWQPLSKQERHEGITIGGSPVVTLDYAQMSARILYGLTGVQPSERDAYTVPGLADHRPGVKEVFNALISSRKILARFPKDTRKLFPRRCRVRDVVELIEAAHPALRHHFCTGVGSRVMFIESCILVETLLALMDRRVVALPVHDALVVSSEHTSITTDVMLHVFHKNTGVKGKVRMDRDGS